MGIIVPVGEYNATFVFGLTGSLKTPTWSLGFEYDGGGGLAPSATLAADLIYEAFTTEDGGERPYDAGAMSSQYTFQGVSVALQTADGPLVGTHFDPITGSVDLPTLPVNCSSLFTKNTNAGGRRNKGRCYIPPCDYGEAVVSSTGVISPSQVGFIETRYGIALADLASAGLTPVLFHSDGGASTPITSLSMGSVIGTQRRRLR